MPSFAPFSRLPLLTAALLSLAIALPCLALAEESALRQKFEDTTARLLDELALAPEQRDKARQVLETSFKVKLQMLSDYGLQDGKLPQLSKAQREELDAGMLAIRASTRGEMVKLLNPQQLETFKGYQRVYHQQFREYLDRKTSDQ